MRNYSGSELSFAVESDLPNVSGEPSVTVKANGATDYVLTFAPTVSAVLCYAVLCCGVLCCGVLCCAVLCCAVLCCAVLCCGVLCCAVLCCITVSAVVILMCVVFICFAPLTRMYLSLVLFNE